jgi:hypothetical protein
LILFFFVEELVLAEEQYELDMNVLIAKTWDTNNNCSGVGKTLEK